MGLEVGEIYEGKVTGITKFGAFISFEEGQTGMVHISEIAPTFVNEIRDFVSEGQTVKVKRLSGEGPVKRRIMDMGITKGVDVFVRKVAPFGDPIEVTVRGYELSLRKADAEMIEVE